MRLRFKLLIETVMQILHCLRQVWRRESRKKKNNNDQNVNWLKTLTKTNHTKQICDNQINYVSFDSIFKTICVCPPDCVSQKQLY